MGLFNLFEATDQAKYLSDATELVKGIRDKQTREALLVLIKSEALFRQHMFRVIHDLKILEERDQNQLLWAIKTMKSMADTK